MLGRPTAPSRAARAVREAGARISGGGRLEQLVESVWWRPRPTMLFQPPTTDRSAPAQPADEERRRRRSRPGRSAVIANKRRHAQRQRLQQQPDELGSSASRALDQAGVGLQPLISWRSAIWPVTSDRACRARARRPPAPPTRHTAHSAPGGSWPAAAAGGWPTSVRHARPRMIAAPPSARRPIHGWISSADEHVDRSPGRVEEPSIARPGQRLAKRVELAHRLAGETLGRCPAGPASRA